MQSFQLTPVIQSVDFIGDKHTSVKEVGNSVNDIARLYVFGGIVVVIDEEDTTVLSPLQLPVGVQIFEIIRVGSQQHPAALRGVFKMVWIVCSSHSQVARGNDRVTCLAQKSDEIVVIRTVVKIEGQRHCLPRLILFQ